MREYLILTATFTAPFALLALMEGISSFISHHSSFNSERR